MFVGHKGKQTDTNGKCNLSLQTVEYVYMFKPVLTY